MDDRIAVNAVGLGLKAEQHAVAQHIGSDGLYVIRRDVIALAQSGMGAGAAFQAQCAAWAYAKLDPPRQIIAVGGWRARCLD